jgi:hypothetical protein
MESCSTGKGGRLRENRRRVLCVSEDASEQTSCFPADKSPSIECHIAYKLARMTKELVLAMIMDSGFSLPSRPMLARKKSKKFTV